MNILPVIYRGFFILFESSSEDKETEIIWAFAEETIPLFSDKKFKQNFRMSPAVFEKLLELLHNLGDNDANSHGGNPELPFHKQVLMTVWCLSNIESFRSVGLKFVVTKSTCWDVLYRICRKLLHLCQRHGIISWPSREKCLEIMQRFEEISQFPGIIGVIDGCHIEITKPKDHPNSYINRKGYPSILLQGVCDNRKLFIDIFTGVPGSVHDYRLYRMSDLSQRIQTNRVHFSNKSHIIGDLAYVLSEKLKVGYKDNGNLTNAQRNFNQKLNRARVVIEHAFPYLKDRLKILETRRQDLIALLIISGCILHNICILEDDLSEEYVNFNDEIREEFEKQVGHIQEDYAGRIKRNQILHHIEGH